MPEMHFVVRWPDGIEQRCYSPSLVVRDHLQVGGSYSVSGFVERSRTLLTIAAERVRAKYGSYCSAAMDQIAEIESSASRYDAEKPVAVVGFELPRPRRAVAVIGGGQAGLSMSYCLKARGIDHFVFEKNRIGHEWRDRRWDTFCLVTPNWQCQLPGYPYKGPEPFGFMKREEIVRYLESYAASFQPPIFEGAAVAGLRRRPGGAFEIETTLGTCVVDQVVVAVGGYHVPSIPRIGERLPADLLQIHSCDYRNPESLPDGDVMVVGTGQSGCQIAEDLHLAGKRVHLCVGSAPRTARRYRGKDVVEWLDAMGYYRMPVHEHPLKERVRGKANHYVTGRDGGRDIDLRKFAREGMQLYGRLLEAKDGVLEFADDLKANLDQADAVSESIKRTIDKYLETNGVDAPSEAPYAAVWEPKEAPRQLDLAKANVRSVVWSTGFRADYRWIELPAFDGKGYPAHQRGVSPVEGLHFLGLPWQYTWGSGRFSGVADDATFLADRIGARLEQAPSLAGSTLNELALGS
ncbi:MAG TPA: MSMEG_0569 family flavin-dependent oxidoreductase [Polyangiaceae bacterium]|jgi:putative flavoprotein involved in K+ transport|nr:MSMEG_0569 family flavin-dependent oxidoreductase [Polyangiaceae bacterium]